MGYVLTDADFESARSVEAAKLDELGFVPVCMAPGEVNDGHSHTLVEEVWVVQDGEGQFQIDKETFDVCTGSVVMVPAGQFHAICNTGKQNLRASVLFNTNVDRDAVVLKTREEHFGEPSVEELCARVDALAKENVKLAKKIAKRAGKKGGKKKSKKA